MAPKLSPPPRNFPKKISEDPELLEYFNKLTNSVYQIFFAVGGNTSNEGIPTTEFIVSEDRGSGIDGTVTLTDSTGTPAADPGWADSSTVDMTAPDGYIKQYNGTQEIALPFWDI